MKSVRIIRKDEAAVSPVIATILMVAITVVLAAVLYVMVSGLISGPGTTPRAVGISIRPTTDQSNWSLDITSVPAGGLSTTGTFLTIKRADGSVALTAKAFNALTWNPDRATFNGDGDTAVEAAEFLLLSKTTYATGRVEVTDGTQILFSGTLA